MLRTFKDRIISLLGWLILQLIDVPGAVKHIHRVQEKLHSSDANCSVQLALIVTDTDAHVFFFDLSHGRFVRSKVGQQVFVKARYGLSFDEGGFDHVDSPELFARRLSQVSRYAFKKSVL
jgi:hypothetical protein